MFSATLDPSTQVNALEFLVEDNICFVRVGELNRAVSTVKQQFLMVLFYIFKQFYLNLKLLKLKNFI